MGGDYVVMTNKFSNSGGRDLGEMIYVILNDYKISTRALSKITGLNEEIFLNFENSNLDDLPDENIHTLSHIAGFLSFGISEISENDRVKGIIEVLIGIFELTFENIALYAKLEAEDIVQFMNDCDSLSFDKRYKLAVTSLFLLNIFK